MRRRGGRGCRCGWRRLRGAFDVGGGQPRGHLGGLAGVFVVHDGVERGQGFHPLRDQLADGGGVAHAGLPQIFLAALRGGDGGAVGLQGGHEGGGHFVRGELRDERGLRRELLQEFIGGGQQRTFIAIHRRAEAVGKTGRGLRDGAGGAGDVLDVQPHGVEQDFLAGVFAGLLSGLGGVQSGDDGAEGGEVGRGHAAGRKVGGVVQPEGFGALKRVVTAEFTIIHVESFQFRG